jgi:hypothetical protein
MNDMQFEFPIHLEFIDHTHPMRCKAEAYVAHRYSEAFDAQLEQFMPLFLALVSKGEIKSLCGFRDAGQEPLFLEQYLDSPIEMYCETLLGHAIKRSELIEFGQLASFSKGFSPLHFYLIARHLVDSGYKWCVCTVTDPLYALFKRLGLSPMDIGMAEASRISTASQWGKYYQHQPRIVAGNLEQSLARLKKVTKRQSPSLTYQEAL